MPCAKFQTNWLTAKYVIGKWDIMRIGSKVRFWPREICTRCTLYCTLLWYVLVQIGLVWVIHFTGTDAIVRYISAYNMEFSLTHYMFTTYCCLLFEDIFHYIRMTHKSNSYLTREGNMRILFLNITYHVLNGCNSLCKPTHKNMPFADFIAFFHAWYSPPQPLENNSCGDTAKHCITYKTLYNILYNNSIMFRQIIPPGGLYTTTINSQQWEFTKL